MGFANPSRIRRIFFIRDITQSESVEATVGGLEDILPSNDDQDREEYLLALQVKNMMDNETMVKH